MSDILEMFRKTLEEESKMLGTPDSCTINRAMELISDAYQLGNEKSNEQKLRERYAGMALQGLLSNPNTFKQFEDDGRYKEIGDITKVIALSSVMYADALIEELRKAAK